MAGMNRLTGRPLDGWQHVSQSIGDILSTPIGTRVMRRDYGSRLAELIDRPMNEATVMEATIAVAEALDRWEPRFQLRRVMILEGSQDGHLSIDVVGVYVPDGHLRTVRVTI